MAFPPKLPLFCHGVSTVGYINGIGIASVIFTFDFDVINNTCSSISD